MLAGSSVHPKAINDQHGHDTGDRILQRIAEILKARMRVQDTVARWGGEEFLVIVESVTRDESASIAESLRQMIEAGTGEILKTTISIGVLPSGMRFHVASVPGFLPNIIVLVPF